MAPPPAALGPELWLHRSFHCVLRARLWLSLTDSTEQPSLQREGFSPGGSGSDRICFPGASAPGSGGGGGCQAWTQAAGWSEGWTSHGNRLWEGELEKQILGRAFISSFASHPALKMNRGQENASQPQGKSKRKAMNTSSTRPFLLVSIKQNRRVCISTFNVPSFQKSQVWTSVRQLPGQQSEGPPSAWCNTDAPLSL